MKDEISGNGRLVAIYDFLLEEKKMFTDQHLAPREANFTALTPLDFLDRAIEINADRPAVAWRGNIWNYREFGEQVARMIHWLKDSGIKKGDVVSTILTNRPELLVAHYAVPAIGAVLNTINFRLDTDDIKFILNHSESRLLIGDKNTLNGLPHTLVPTACLCSSYETTDGLNFFHGEKIPFSFRSAISDELLPISLSYTSGTTGHPKGVVYNHRGAYLNAIGNLLALGFNSNTRYLWTLPMFHCNGWTHSWAVTAGGGLHVCLDEVNPEQIIQMISDHQVSHMCCAPVVLYMLLNYMTDPTNVRVKVGTGGAAPTATLIAGLEALGFDLMHLYGLTECYGPATFNDPDTSTHNNPIKRADTLARQGQRHPMCGIVRVVGKDGLDVPNDGQTIGEILLQGNTLMAGYLKDSKATQAAFENDFFHTGDLAVKHPDGQLQIKDRAKDIIISGGENFSSLEVESVLHSHPKILLAAVVAAPHEKWGETAWAYVEPKDNTDLDISELDNFCRKHLAGFKRPRRYIIGDLPKTATGKIQKFLLREKAKEEGRK